MIFLNSKFTLFILFWALTALVNLVDKICLSYKFCILRSLYVKICKTPAYKLPWFEVKVFPRNLEPLKIDSSFDCWIIHSFLCSRWVSSPSAVCMVYPLRAKIFWQNSSPEISTWQNSHVAAAHSAPKTPMRRTHLLMTFGRVFKISVFKLIT